MKPHYLLLSVIFLSIFPVAAQQNVQAYQKPKELAFDVLATQSPMLNRNFFGFAIDAKYYVEEKWGTGFSFTLTSKKITSNYAYNVSEPDVSYLSIGWLNQWDVIRDESVRVGLNLNNGVGIASLRDRSETEIFWDEFGYTEVPVSKARNVFYIIEPGITASFRLIKTKNEPNIFLTTQAKYRKAFGNPEFAKSQDFSNYFIGVGVSFVGFFDSL